MKSHGISLQLAISEMINYCFLDKKFCMIKAVLDSSSSLCCQQHFPTLIYKTKLTNYKVLPMDTKFQRNEKEVERKQFTVADT